MFGIARKLRSTLCLPAVLLVAVGATGCASVPDWVDPTSWMGSSPPASTADTSSSNQPATADQATGVTVAEASDKYPNLAEIPDKAPPATSSDEQKQVAQGLLADRAQVQYSADALRGGTEPAAAPPPPAAPEQSVADLAASTSADTAVDGNAAGAPAAASGQSADVNTPGSGGAVSDHDLPTGPAPMPGALPLIRLTGGTHIASQTSATSVTAPAPAPVISSPIPAPSVTPQSTRKVQPAATSPAATRPKTAVAAVTPSMTNTPAPPVSPAAITTAPSADTVLGFQRSKAPALDPTVAQFVSPELLAHYEQAATMSAAATAPSATPAASVVPTEASAPSSRKVRHRRSKTAGGVGGPEQMSGAVVANFDALQSSSASSAAYTGNGGQAPTAVVLFPHDTTILTADARVQVHAAVEAFREAGEKGFIKVVGHSSSRTANMPLDRHLVYNFERSQARATAVARELIKEGVPADRVLVEAVGDSQPVYYESMPQGEEGNRRAEIFLQS